MRINNNTLSILILVFIALTIINVNLIMHKIDIITGQSTSAIATVGVNITIPNITDKRITRESTGVIGGGPTDTNVFFSLRPSDGFTISTGSFDIVLRQIIIRNGGDLTQTLKFESNLDIISFDKSSLNLRPNEEGVINIRLLTDKPGIYVGKISISSEFLSRELPITINIKSKEAKFNVNLKIDEEFRTIKQGEQLPLELRISELTADYVDIMYLIKDSNNNVITKVSEIKSVKGYVILKKLINIPDKLKEGTYIIGVEVRYKGLVNIDSEKFKVVRSKKPVIEEPKPTITKSYSPMILFILLVLILLHVILRSKTKKPKT